MSIENLKKRANNLQRAAQAMFGQPVKVAPAYEFLPRNELQFLTRVAQESH